VTGPAKRYMLSAMHTHVSPEPDQAEAQPACLWRNWYRSLVDHEVEHLGLKQAGDVWPGRDLYPSKEAAEERALAYLEIRRMLSDEIDGEPERTEYLGAREVGDDA